jgi:uncharacterized membrane protein YfcA
VDVAHVALIAAAACAAGIVNAIAGGGSLISFPVLVYCGMGNVAASMTNTVALCPGYFGATLAQRPQLVGQGARVGRLLPLAVAGSLVGSYILLTTSEKSFTIVVPWLLMFAAALLAVQVPLRKRLVRRGGTPHSLLVAAVPVGLAAIYGAYFGAGLGVIILAVLGVVIDDTLPRANAVKQVLSLVINVIAALIYLVRGQIAWDIAAIVAVGSLIGGAIGGRIAARVPEMALRIAAITVAVIVAAIYFARQYL